MEKFDSGFMLSIFSIALGVLAIFFLVQGAKKEKLPISRYLNKFFLSYFDLLLFSFLIMSFLAEATVATSVHPVNSQIINSGARYTTHLSMSLLGFICSIAAPKLIVGWVQSFSLLTTKKNAAGKIIQESSPGFFITIMLTALFATAMTIYVPYLNALVIAKALNQVKEFEYAYSRLIMPWKIDALADAAHYARGLDPSEILEFNMNNSYLLMICHIVGSVLKGLFASLDSYIINAPTLFDEFILTRKERLKKANEEMNEAINNRRPSSGGGGNSGGNASPNNSGNSSNANNATPDPEDEPAPEAVDPVKVCASIFPIVGDAVIKDVIKKIKDHWATIDPDQLVIVLSEFNNMAAEINKIKEDKAGGIITEPVYIEKRSNLQDSVRHLINSPVANGGMGLTIAEMEA